MTMKKEITPEDLNLNIEVTGGERLTPKFTQTLTCPQTRNNCTDATFDKPQLCDTTTTNPTEQNCLSVGENECKPTDNCPLTIEPACETKVGCQDSNSNAELCCPISEKANTLCANCITAGTCGADSECNCLISKNVCETEDKFCPISGQDETCMCVYTDQDTCEPLEPVTELTGCNLCNN